MGGENFFLFGVQAAVVATGTSRVIVPAGQTTACYDADYHLVSEVSVITVPSREGRGFNPAAACHPLTPSPHRR